MCEFTVYLNGHEDSDVVAKNVIKSKVKADHISLMDSSGKTYRIEKAYITKVDSIMAEMQLESMA
ncbi:MAG: CooT family nickel-binding protein [Candidatus Methanomethylophilaceae archaeon]|nr:CooT family nickel-binding protein [Candidatus Methanomethylophilaceae archaeon]